MPPSLSTLGLLLVAGCPADLSEEGRALRPVDHLAMEWEVHRLVNRERSGRRLSSLKTWG